MRIAVPAKQVVASAWPIRVYIWRRAVASGGSSSGPVNPYSITFRQTMTAPRALSRSAAARAVPDRQRADRARNQSPREASWAGVGTPSRLQPRRT